MSEALKILNRVFGYPSFRGEQESIIDHVVGGGSALVLMPTGGGKSLCYQIPALVRPGTAVVISPLIALMQNQVSALKEYGVRAEFLNSSLNADEQRRVEGQFLAGELDLLYLAPERLMSDYMLETLEKSDVSLFAIDEAHCVSQWGHDFRKEYLQLSILAERFPGVPRLALTATADERTRSEIVSKLSLNGPVYISDFDRPNIQYRIAAKDTPKNQLLHFLKTEHDGDSGIVYCMTRKKTEDFAKFLNKNNINAYAYHAGMSHEHRTSVQDKFLGESSIVIVATIAFGMGIDKPDVRFVAHVDLSKNIEAYYQETGRAGRDGEPATAWMVYGFQDVVLLRQMLERSDSDEIHKRVEQAKLNSFLGLCEGTGCRRQLLLQYFGQVHDGSCGNCDLCINPVKTFDGTVAAQKVLSAVYRTGQRFGANYLIDLLIGKENERMVKFGHQNLPTFGVGGEFNDVQWKSIIRQLIAFNFIAVDEERFGGLRLSPLAGGVLKGETTVSLHEDILHQKASKKKRAKASLSYEFDSSENPVFQKLRELRKTLAKKAGIPSYMIFHDAALKEMAQVKPKSLDEFSEISGVGEKKLAKYGAAFLEVVASN
ncbi:DNA helicase RecQ [Oligoflexaceae bacterium]|nr:DNA helicase RecQ [Oligoflexaceae bacterium]